MSEETRDLLVSLLIWVGAIWFCIVVLPMLWPALEHLAGVAHGAVNTYDSVPFVGCGNRPCP